ncbi:organic solute transporter Ostalpha-domain-containing protein [Xylariales sp. PMI_506]|nr:organic solute transporter Ostalpha-domain-containing protein [Xylariales sp. PMI_506]
MGAHHSTANGDNSTHVCTQPVFNTTAMEPIAGKYDFHQINVVISGICAAFATVSLAVLMFRHATHFSKPKEQAEILRISVFLPIYGIGSFIEVCAPTTYVYLQPWLEVVQSFALASFFLMMCRFLSNENASNTDVFLAPFRAVQAKSDKPQSKQMFLYQKHWFMTFQYPVVSILVAIFTDITQAAKVYCYGSRETYFASLWLGIATKASMAMAVVNVVQVYTGLKQELKPYRAIQKLLAFKTLIGLQFLQGIVYMILTRINPSPLAPTAKLSYTDINLGIPLLIVELELVVFAIFFQWAYSPAPYLHTSYAQTPLSVGKDDENADRSYQGGFLGIRAGLMALNLSEFFAALAFGPKIKNAIALGPRNSDAHQPLNPVPYGGAEPASPMNYPYDPSSMQYGEQQQQPQAPGYQQPQAPGYPQQPGYGSTQYSAYNARSTEPYN